MARSRSLIVAGAGIGGLAAAIQLAKADYRILVFERAAALGESGAGLQLTPNATRALREIGVLDAIRPRATAPQALIVSDAVRGHDIIRADLRDVESRYGAPWLVLARSDLHRALSEMAADNLDVVIETGTEVVDFADHPRGVTVSVVKQGESREETGAAVIGADGLRSNIRARLHGKTPPRFHQLAVWRATVPAKGLPSALAEPAVRLWLANKGHAVHYPISGGEAINLVLVFPEEREGNDGEEKSIKQLPPFCERWARPLQELIAAAPSFRRWPLYDRPILKSWGKGNATLLGDAAHPMLPFVAQGAAAALEDAVELARYLHGADEIAPYLRGYESERAERGARLQIASIDSGRAYHASGLIRFARDLFLPRMKGDWLVARNDWIYRYAV